MAQYSTERKMRNRGGAPERRESTGGMYQPTAGRGVPPRLVLASRPMSDEEIRAEAAPKGVTEDDILADFTSRYAGVLCPVHGGPPRFEMDSKGGVIEAFCCEALAQIFRELRRDEPKDEAAVVGSAAPKSGPETQEKS